MVEEQIYEASDLEFSQKYDEKHAQNFWRRLSDWREHQQFPTTL